MACNLRRENGLFDGRVDKAMAWSEGLEQRVLHSRKEKALPMEYTNIVYVETLQAIIFGLQAKHGITKSTQV